MEDIQTLQPSFLHKPVFLKFDLQELHRVLKYPLPNLKMGVQALTDLQVSPTRVDVSVFSSSLLN